MTSLTDFLKATTQKALHFLFVIVIVIVCCVILLAYISGGVDEMNPRSCAHESELNAGPSPHMHAIQWTSRSMPTWW